MAQALGALKASQSKVTQRINLRDLLGRTPSEEEKDAFVLGAIAVIEDRTQSGDDLSGNSFKPYSQDYAEDKGVSRNDVDLFGDGDMFDAIEPVRFTRDTVEYGIVDGDQAPKAYNHQVGDTLPKREWFGITAEEAREIAREIEDENLTEEVTESDIRIAIRDLLL